MFIIYYEFLFLLLYLKIEENENLSQNELYEKLEIVLIERTKPVDENNRKINPKVLVENRFILGQFYFEAVTKLF